MSEQKSLKNYIINNIVASHINFLTKAEKLLIQATRNKYDIIEIDYCASCGDCITIITNKFNVNECYYLGCRKRYCRNCWDDLKISCGFCDRENEFCSQECIEHCCNEVFGAPYINKGDNIFMCNFCNPDPFNHDHDTDDD